MIDCCATPGLIPLTQAKNTLLEAISPLQQHELIKLEDADKRVLAEQILSPINVPAHNNSAMDGYAFCLADNAVDSNRTFTTFELVGTALAGQPYSGALKAGQCIRIMTGAVVPAQAHTVEMQENVEVSVTTIKPLYQLERGKHIRHAGEDIRQHQQVFKANHQLNAIDIGVLASLGVEKVNVIRRPKVAILATGDELKPAGSPLSLGDIYESNRHLIAAMLARLNIEVIDLGIVADSKQATRDAFINANKQADAVISSGGVSVGDADFVKEVLAELGEVGFWKVAIKPGKPFAFGKLADSLFFGLPGNPVSAAVTFHQLVVPALAKLAGNVDYKGAKQLAAIALAPIKKRAGRMDFQRGIASVNDHGQLEVTPLDNQGSGVLTSLSRANCYIVLPQEHQGCPTGSSVMVELFDQLMA